MTRRDFLAGASAGLLAGCVSDGRAPGILSCRSPNGKIRHACVGTGNMAWGDLNSFRTHPKVEIAALCDVDSAFLARAKALEPNARVYRDWREMLAKEGDAIDSVNVSIPDHNHTVVSVTAMRMGKHVYCQKPLCHDIDECGVMRAEAARACVVTQLGSQYAASLGDRLTVELLRAGAFGPVRRAWLFSTRNGLSRRKREEPVSAKPPATLDWDLWLGTAPVRDYAEKVYHPLLWRIWHDFGSGWIGDIGCHLHSSLWIGMGLDKTAPLAVEARVDPVALTEPIYRKCWPLCNHIAWEYPGVAASGGEPFRVDWYDGFSDPSANTDREFLPPAFLAEMAARTPLKKLPQEGKVIECAEAYILAPHGGSCVPVVVMKNGSAAPKLPKLDRVPTHFHEFLDACLAGRRARSDFGWSTYMMEAILTGNIAERVPGRMLLWDGASHRFTNSPRANSYLKRAYRAPFTI